jgi:carboxymethylenebutenolidase
MSSNTLRAAIALLASCGVFGCGAPQSSSPSPGPPAPDAAATAAAQEHATPAPTPAASLEPAVAVLEQELAYGESAKNNLVGYLAMPQDAAEPLPGIIVIHEWWGLNDDIKALTRRLAGEGYVALAVDLYGGVTAETPDAARALMAALVGDPDAARNNLRQAYDYLEKYAFAPRIASIGFGLGGGLSLETALDYPGELDATVMYYGPVQTDRARLAALNVPILGFFGAEDASIPVRDVQEFRAALAALGKTAEVLIVPRVGPAFANPSGGNYDEQAANDAWLKTRAFLERHLQLGASTVAR